MFYRLKNHPFTTLATENVPMARFAKCHFLYRQTNELLWRISTPYPCMVDLQHLAYFWGNFLGKYSTSMDKRGTPLKAVKNTPIRSFLKTVNKNTWNFLKTHPFWRNFRCLFSHRLRSEVRLKMSGASRGSNGDPMSGSNGCMLRRVFWFSRPWNQQLFESHLQKKWDYILF